MSEAEKTVLLPPFLELTVSKELAAARQTEFAIAAFATGDFDVAITLAGAAEGMLPEIPSQPMFSRLVEKAKSTGRWSHKEVVTLVNFERDWLKHLTPDFPAEITIEAGEAAYAVIRAMAKLPDEWWTERMSEFKRWYLEEFIPQEHIYREVIGTVC